jgi:hypothetical protein
VALIVTWLTTGLIGRALDGVLVPVLGFLLLPWTMLAYVLLYDSGRQVEGFEWVVVALGFVFDLSSMFGGRQARR